MSRRAGGARARLAAAALLAVVAVAGCGGSDDGLPDDPGYVAGDGAIVQFDAARRGEPVELAGTTAAGERLDLADLRGSVVVLNVWYATCGPCNREAPTLVDTAKATAADGVRFLGINTDHDDDAQARSYVEKYAVPFPSLDDREGRALLALRGQVPPKAVPSTVVLDRQGRVAARVIGEVKALQLRQLIDEVARA